MRYLSICSGIEAASVAWAPLGWSPVAFSEIEPFPCAVLAHHYPDVPNLGDMTRLPDLIRAGQVEAPDILCGGTPCQAFSVAGLRKSLADERGNLTLKFVEIADAIDSVRVRDGRPPAIVFWENVPGVLSTKDNAFGCFLGALAGEDCELKPPGMRWADAGCVFGPQRAIAWRVLDAQYFGLAQRRRRVFVVASARDDFDPAAVLFEFDGVRRDIAPSRGAGKEVAGTISSRTTGGGGLGTDFECAGGLQPVAQPIGIFQDSEFGVQQYDSAGTLRAGRIPEHQMVMQPIAIGTDCYNGSITGDVACTMGTPGSSVNASGPTVMQAMQVRRLTPVECERLMGFPDNYTLIPWRNKPASECPDGPRYKALGNSWAVPVVRWIGRRIHGALN